MTAPSLTLLTFMGHDMNRLQAYCATAILFLALTCAPAPARAGGTSGDKTAQVKCFNVSNGTYCGTYSESLEYKSDMSGYCGRLTSLCSEKFPVKCPQGSTRSEFIYRIRTDLKKVQCP